MTKTKLLTAVLLVVGSALGLSGCGPVAPTDPTYDRDIRPLLVARCIRCHATPGTRTMPANLPPTSLNRPVTNDGFNFDYPQLSDPLPAGLLILRTLGPRSVRGEVPGRQMPPEPAERLEDWQIEMLATWSMTNPPR